MNELKVGFLTILAVVSLIIVSMTITANKSGFGDYVEYKTIIKDATGIFERSSIKVAGIVAGRIKSIQLSGSHALIKFEVLENIKLTKFSALRVKSVGFLGDKYIDIYLGDPDAQRLPAGSLVQAEGGDGLEQLGKDAGEILKDVKVIAKAIRESLYDGDQKNVIKHILSNVRDFTEDAKRIGASLNELVEENTENLDKTLENLDRITAQLAHETDRHADESLLNDLSKLKPIMANVDDAVEDLRLIVADVKDGKGTVGKLLRDEEVIDKVSETLSGVNRIVNRVNNFKTNVNIFSGMSFDKGSRTEFSVDLIPSPEKFFRFGLIQTDFGRDVKKKKKVTTSTGGSSSTTETQTVNKTDFKLNAQIGRKLNNWTFRVGMVDSTGGLGIDYSIPHYGFTSFLEAHNFDQDLGVSWRVGLDFRLWNILHARFMADDLASKFDDQAYSFSMGLKFTDEDLATLFGLAL